MLVPIRRLTRRRLGSHAPAVLSRPAAPRARIARPTRRIAARVTALLPLVLLLSGCDLTRTFRWGFPWPVTAQGRRMTNLWVGSVWAAVGVGLLVYGLILFACFRYRKRGEALPRQIHYNVPVEVLYTVLPFVVVCVLFYFTARDEIIVDKLSAHPDVTIGVVGFQWNWQFNYPDEQLQVTGRPGQYPTLVLPDNKRVQFIETSPDVVHSFWVPDFIFKRDVIPGRTNKFEIRTESLGTFEGRCAEFCGVYHSRMLFRVRIVTDSQYRAFLTYAKAQAATGRSPIYSTTAGGTTIGNPTGYTPNGGTPGGASTSSTPTTSGSTQ